MTFNVKKHHDDLLFLPLGGAGEIGMNMNLYQLDGKWLMVDCGAGFAEDYMPGIDMIVPQTEFIEQHRDDLLGIVLTHAHEDHLGGLVHLWEEFDCPVYATPFTAAFLRLKIKENPALAKHKIIEVASNSTFDIGPFGIEMVQITHSVPEMNALVIHTRHGNIFHTGDWKLDPSPMVGPATDEVAIAKYGKKGILAMIGDSTNVFSPGWSGSEGDVRSNIADIIKSCDQLVLIATFASNVARLESIFLAAEAAGRDVVMCGRSLWRILEAAQASGYLTDIKQPLSEAEFDPNNRHKQVVLATGCQGEPLAATNKIVQGQHRFVRLKQGDTAIFSGKIIPGNEKRIFRLFNQLTRENVNVVTEKTNAIHVSGHPNRDELKKMYELVKPKISLPVHGEDMHMSEHVKLAKSWGVEHAFKMENGIVMKLAPGEPEKIAMVEHGIYGLDGMFYRAPDCNVMKQRRKMRREGIVFISLIVEFKGLAEDPIVLAPGLLDPKEDNDIIQEIIASIHDRLGESLQGRNKITDQTVIQITRGAVRKVLKAETGKKPSIEIALVRL